MNLKDTSVSHHKLPKQARIEMDMWTANARFSFLGMVSKKKKKKQEEEECLAIPLWSKFQAPQIGRQTPQHWLNNPHLLWCSIDQHGSKHFKKSRPLKSREEMMSSTLGDKPHTNTKYEQYCTPFQQKEIYIWRIKCLYHEEWNPPLTIV